MRTRLLSQSLGATCLCLATAGQATAVEYAFSTYPLGSAGFGAGVTPPPGTYVTALTSYYTGDIGAQLNPVPEEQWGWTPSIKMIRDIVGSRMFPLTLEGLDRAMRELMR